MEDVPEFKRTTTEGSYSDKKPVDDVVVIDEEKSIQSSEDVDEVKVIEKAEEVALLVSSIYLHSGHVHSDDGLFFRLSARRTTLAFLSSPSVLFSWVSG